MLQNYRTKLLDYLSEEFEFNIIFRIYQGTDINAEYPNLNRKFFILIPSSILG